MTNADTETQAAPQGNDTGHHDAPATILKKLSVKAIMNGGENGANIRRAAIMLPSNGDSLPLCDVIGSAMDFATGESDKGEWQALIGTFESLNLHTGVVQATTKIFLPSVVALLVIGQLKRFPGVAVDFAYRLNVQRDDSAANGYIYTAQDLVPPNPNGAMAQLRKQISRPALRPPIIGEALRIAGPTRGAAAPAPAEAAPAARKGRG